MTIAYVLPLIGSSRWGSHGQAVSERRRSRASVLIRASAVDDKRTHGDFSLYNTMTGKKEVFDRTVHEDGVVRFYSCGPTVYDSAHVGNFRAFFDLRRFEAMVAIQRIRCEPCYEPDRRRRQDNQESSTRRVDTRRDYREVFKALLRRSFATERHTSG
mmetsp:Transcript_18261/g.73269  ORF Transcript_18261/g.73269 Transcript_18261/m.73269 type:complete len:158 (+) Transcript_18261:105-578(+)